MERAEEVRERERADEPQRAVKALRAAHEPSEIVRLLELSASVLQPDEFRAAWTRFALGRFRAHDSEIITLICVRSRFRDVIEESDRVPVWSCRTGLFFDVGGRCWHKRTTPRGGLDSLRGGTLLEGGRLRVSVAVEPGESAQLRSWPVQLIRYWAASGGDVVIGPHDYRPEADRSFREVVAILRSALTPGYEGQPRSQAGLRRVRGTLCCVRHAAMLGTPCKGR